MSVVERWQSEIEQPTEGFFAAFAARISVPEGARDAVREAVKTLVPRIDWEAYQPHVPHGILGLRAVLRLRPLLEERSFHRMLATQLHMAAHEGRRAASLKTAAGSGNWRNLEDFIRARRPGLAYAEAQGFEAPAVEDFRRLGALVSPDMANVGHKRVMADHLGDLFEGLDRPKATGRRLLGLAAWLAATPEDTFWHRRAAARLEDAAFQSSEETVAPEAEALLPLVREVCDLGLVALLDRLTARVKAGLSQGDLQAALALAAAEKVLDARRDLEGKTAWTFVYLATLARTEAADPRLWAQAAAMVNLFPTDEPEDRVTPHPPTGQANAEALLDAVLDAEVSQAMGQAEALVRAGETEAVLRALAEAATRNDPAFNHAHQTLAVAAVADLAATLPAFSLEAVIVSLTKNIANSQGSGDLGRQAGRILSDSI